MRQLLRRDQAATATRAAPLPAPLVRRFEPLVGHRINDVRIHHDAAAATSAQALGARAYTVGRDVVFGDGQYRPGTAEGDALLRHELVHVAQQGTAAVHGPLEVADRHDPLERDQHAVGSGVAKVCRVEVGESIARFFGGGTFSDQELQVYLELLDRTQRIEDDYDSDNKAREIVARWKRGDSAYLLPAGRKILLIRELISGFTGDDDERAILDLLSGATDAELARIRSEIGVGELRGNLHFAERDELDRLLAARQGVPAQPSRETFTGETALMAERAFNRNSEAVNRRNCIQIVRDMAPKLFAEQPELAARITARLGLLKGGTDTMVHAGNALAELGVVSAQAKVRFGNGNGSRPPTDMVTSAWDTILGMVGNVQGWHVFGLAVMDGYHSVTVLVDNRADGARVYWADQWRIDPGDDFHQEAGSESGFRRYERAGFDGFITEKTQEWWNEVHSPTSKCGKRHPNNWDSFCRYPTTLHIWKFRSSLEGRP